MHMNGTEKSFTDMHTHILFDTDDGSGSPEESLLMYEADVREGAACILATPHYSVDEPTDPQALTEKAAKLRTLIAETYGNTDRPADGKSAASLNKTGPGAPFKNADGTAGDTSLPQLFLGNEVLYFDGMCEHLKEGRILTLAGSDRVLIEFYPPESYAVILRAVRSLVLNGYVPVVAHAERFFALRKYGLKELTENGAEVQIGSDVFEYGLFDSTLSWCKKMLRLGLVSYLGTDMHGSKSRPPKAARCVSWCLKNLSPDEAAAVLYRNAEKNLLKPDA